MTIIIINDETQQAKAFLEYAKKLPFVKVKSGLEKIPNRTTLKAMRDAETGKVTRTQNVKDLIGKLKS